MNCIILTLVSEIFKSNKTQNTSLIWNYYLTTQNNKNDLK